MISIFDVMYIILPRTKLHVVQLFPCPRIWKFSGENIIFNVYKFYFSSRQDIKLMEYGCQLRLIHQSDDR